jgi:cytochrome P450
MSGLDPADFLMQKSLKYGKVFSLYAASRYVVVLNGRAAIHEALVTRGSDFADRITFHVERLTNPQRKGISFRSYNDGFKHVKKLSLSIVKHFGFGSRIMESRILNEVDELIQHIRDLDGVPFYPMEILAASIANVAMNILYGRRFDRTDPTLRQLIVDVGKSMSQLVPEIDIFPVLRLLPRYRRVIEDAVAAFGRVLTFCEDNVTKCLQCDNGNVETFVRSFVDAEGEAFDWDELTFALRDITFPSIYTTSNSMLWAFVLLANHPTVQDRIHADIDSAVDKHRLPNLDDLPRLPYVEATILELNRYRTLIPLGGYHATLKDTQVAGYFVPEGTMVLVNLHSINMDPDTWQEPHQFRPERFLDETGHVVDRDKTVPFSLGKRACWGEHMARQETFLYFAGLLQNFKILPPEGDDRIDVGEIFSAVVSPTEFKVRLICRTSLT